MSIPLAAGFLAPTPNLDTAAWWAEMAEGRVTIPECRSCGQRSFPPQPFCSHCGSPDCPLVPVDGDGRVYSWVVANRSFAAEFDADVPYGIVAVDLSGGGRLIGRYTGDPTELLDGLRVRATVELKDGFGLLWFEPVTE